MGYFFNIVHEDFDNIRSNHYLDPNDIPSKEKKLKLIEKITNFSKKIQLRLFTFNELYTYRSEPSYYIVHDLKDIKISEDETSLYNLPIDVRLRDVISTQENLFL